MIAYTTEFASEQGQALAEQVQKFREQPIESMREVAVKSAAGIKSLKAPVRAFAHSGVKLAAVSQNAMQDLIELESDVVTSALTAASLRLERAVEVGGVQADEGPGYLPVEGRPARVLAKLLALGGRERREAHPCAAHEREGGRAEGLGR
mgnify:CR=1 FL=1